MRFQQLHSKSRAALALPTRFAEIVVVCCLCWPYVSIGQIAFEDVSELAGMQTPEETWGAAWGDFDSDGLPDIWNNNHRTAPTLYRNRGDGTFESSDPTAPFGVGEADAHGPSWADIDRDGDLDLLESVGGAADIPNHRNQVWMNEGGSLVDRALELGLRYARHQGRSVLSFDPNRDGRLDLVFTGYPGPGDGFPSTIFTQTPSGTFEEVSDEVGFDCKEKSSYAVLADVTGDGALDLICHGFRFPQRVYDISTVPFRDVGSILPQVPLSGDVALGDFNGDLQTDLFVLTLPGSRSNVARDSSGRVLATLNANGNELGIDVPHVGRMRIDLTAAYLDAGQIRIGASGWTPPTQCCVLSAGLVLDATDPLVQGLAPHRPGAESGLFIGYDQAAKTWRVRLSAANGEFQAFWGQFEALDGTSLGAPSAVGFDPADGRTRPALLLSQRTTSGYVNATMEAGLGEELACNAATAGDFDNDMDLDLYLACGQAPLNEPNILLDNQGDGGFVSVPNAGGAAGSGVGTAMNVVRGDYDLDGFLDLFVTNGYNRGTVPNGPDQLFRNRGNSNYWIELDLVGTQSNVHGIGARVLATAGGVTQLREQDGGNHQYAQDHMRLHFGLGANSVVDLRVEWPSGAVDQFDRVPSNRIYRLVEGGGLGVFEIGLTPPAPTDVVLPCGAPTIDSTSDAGLFAWKECPNGPYRVMASAGGSSSVSNYSGRVEAVAGFTDITTFDLTGSDRVILESNENLTYDLHVLGNGSDSFGFMLLGDAAAACLGIEAPAGSLVKLGPNAAVSTLPVNLGDGGACQLTALARGAECGEPEQPPKPGAGALQLWRACPTDEWYLRLVVGDTVATTLRAQGSVSAEGLLGTAAGYELESSDVMTVPDASSLEFDLRSVAGGVDGLDLQLGASSSHCLQLGPLSDMSLQVGANGVPVGTSFDLRALRPCGASSN